MSIAARKVTTTKTSAYTANVNEVVPVNATAGAFSVALPRPINGAGKAPVTIGPKADGTANAVTVTTPTGTIIGMASLATQGDVCTYATDGINWFALDTPAVAAAPTAPSAPTSVVGTRGNTQVSVAFTPGSANGSPITGYTVTTYISGVAQTPTTPGASSPVVVTGLTNGQAYTFTVHATNAIGSSAESSPSAAVTPATTPGAPTIGTATAGDTTASFAFTAPASNGGTAITGYTATLTPGGATFSNASSPITATGLTNGQAYTATVHATNGVGNGAETAASNSVTPAAFSPLLLPSLVRWGDPQLLTAGALSSYPDQSSAATTVTAPVAANRPTVVASVLSGKKVVRYDGTANFLVSADFATAKAQPNTAIIVIKIPGALPNTPKLIDGGGAGRNAVYVTTGTSGSLLNVPVYAGAGGGSAAADAYSYGTWAILLVEFNGASSKLYVNGGTAYTGVCGSADTNAQGRITLGCDAGQGVGFAAADYVDDIFCNSLLTVAQKNQIGNWLVAKYPALTWTTVTA